MWHVRPGFRLVYGASFARPLVKQLSGSGQVTVRGGVSYTVGEAAAPPTWGSAPQTFYVATPNFTRFKSDFASEWL